MKKIIVITSGKGGVGKTTTAINLGAAMNYFGKDVLVIDGNLTTPNIGIHLNSPEVPINLNHVLLGKADAFEAVYEHESGIKIMPSSLSIKDLGKIKPERIKDFKEDFKKVSEYVIVDSSAGLGNEALSLIKMADELIIVTNPEMPAITDALKALKIAEQMKKVILGVIVTRVKKNDIEMSPESVREMLETPILGMVPEDISVQKSLSMKDAVVHTHPKSKAARAYKEIAAKLLEVPYDSDKDRERLVERILKKFGLVKKKK
jgi:septum site-determining protein MinD